jgi:NADPH:quinone reductase-like Zn-dependent oxidoreductase
LNSSIADQVDGNDGREHSPLVSERGWNELCVKNGFSEAEVILPDFQNEYCQESSVMIFTAIEDRGSSPDTDITLIIVVKNNSPNQQKIARTLEVSLLRNGCSSCQIATLLEAAKSPNLNAAFCISLLEIDEPAIRDFSEVEYKALQELIVSGAKLLWVTRLGGSDEPPSQGIMDGLSRVLRTEDPALVLVNLELSCMEDETSIRHIIDVFMATLKNVADHSFEPEYKEIGGILHIKRIIEESSLDRQIWSQLSATQAKTYELAKGPPLRVNVASPGLLDSLQLVEDEEASRPLANDEIEVEVKAIGLNFMDLLTALGRLGDKSVMGTECAGIVSRLGSAAEGEFRIGDRVVVAYLNLCRTYARCPFRSAVLIPDKVSFTDAAAVPTSFGTAYHSLHEIARMRKGETILIHSATGGTGQSAIQIAQDIGAEIFATVGSDAKKTFLMETYEIPEDHIFFSRNISFAQGIRRMTSGVGVDVVLNSLSGEGLVASWECVAPYGRFIEIGKKDIHAAEQLPMLPFAKNVSFSAVDMAAMTLERPWYMGKLLKMLMQKAEACTISPSKPLQVYPLSEIEQAFRHMQSGQSMGKLVLEIDRHVDVLVR